MVFLGVVQPEGWREEAVVVVESHQAGMRGNPGTPTCPMRKNYQL